MLRALLLAAALGRLSTDGGSGGRSARAGASSVAPARAAGGAPARDARWRALAHGGLRGGAAAVDAAAAGPGSAAMVVRVRTREGVRRLSVPTEPGLTVADVQRLIEAQLGIAVSAQTSLTLAGAPLAPGETLAAAGVAHGALLALEHTGDDLLGAAPGASAAAGAGGPGRRPRARKLDDLVAEQAALQIRLQAPPEPACSSVSVDEASCAAFLADCRAAGFGQPRYAYLYGRALRNSRTRASLDVAVVHPVPAELCARGGAEPPPECARAAALARHLGLQRVGWLVARAPAAGHRVSAAELATAARLQAEAQAGAEGEEEEAAEAARCFITLVATPRRARAKGRALGAAGAEGASGSGAGGGPDEELSVEAYQPTAAFVSLVREGKLRPARAAGADAAGLLEPTRPELSLVGGGGAPWPNRTAPVEFFAARVFELTRVAGWLASGFGPEPPYEPRGGAGPAAAVSDEALAELREHVAERRGEPLDSVLLDWRLLLTAGGVLTDGQLGALCDAALEADTAGLLRAQRQLERLIAERVGAEEEEE